MQVTLELALIRQLSGMDFFYDILKKKNCYLVI